MKLSRIFLGSAMVVSSLFLILVRNPGEQLIVSLATRYLSTDQDITVSNLRQLIFMYRTSCLIITASGLLILITAKKEYSEALVKGWHRIVYSDLHMGVDDPGEYSRRLFIAASASGIGLTTLSALAGKLSIDHFDVEDGVLETLTVVILLISSILAAWASMDFVRIHPHNRSYSMVAFFYGLFGFLFLLFALEEISWGQRIFGWSTPPLISQVNQQNETNIHNIFNTHFLLLYRLISLILLPVLLSIILRVIGKRKILLELALPHPNLIGLATLIALISLGAGFDRQELLELLLAVFAGFYALRAKLCAASPPIT